MLPEVSLENTLYLELPGKSPLDESQTLVFLRIQTFQRWKTRQHKEFPRKYRKKKKKPFFPLTNFKALRSWVALLVPLTASELHELNMQLIQNAPFHCVHCVCELWMRRPGR